jgi:hypothetical protein
MPGDESILTVVGSTCVYYIIYILYYILAYGQGITNVLFGIAASTKMQQLHNFLPKVEDGDQCGLVCTP